MSKRIRIYTKVTPEELAQIREKMSEMDVRNRSAYLRKMALDGYCVNMDFSDIRELVSLLRRCSNNLNQYAKIANAAGAVYRKDVESLRKDFVRIRECADKILASLMQIPGIRV